MLLYSIKKVMYAVFDTQSGHSPVTVSRQTLAPCICSETVPERDWDPLRAAAYIALYPASDDDFGKSLKVNVSS